MAEGTWVAASAAPSLAGRAVRRAVTAAVAALAISLATAATASAGATATRYFYATEEAFVVPQGVSSVQIVAIGGHGGKDAGGVSGGAGARVSGELAVAAGQTLYVHVGGNGANSVGNWGGGGGGGSSDVRTAPLSSGLSPDPRLIVAGGGGGAGGRGPNGNFGTKGSAGGNAGEFGEGSAFAFGGGPGTQTQGGEAGEGECGGTTTVAASGSLETGGSGGYCSAGEVHGGDGGDGYYGGGGGGAEGPPSITREPAAGGGGGSSLVPVGGSLAVVTTAPQVQISYTQPANPPAVITGASSGVTAEAATVHGTVNPEDEEVTACAFEYGTGETYGQSAPCTSAPGSGVSPVAVSAPLTGLIGATTYHFRITATNGSGTSQGTDGSFTTLAHNPPAVTAVSPSVGPVTGGASVTITGTELAQATAVKFGSADATGFTINSSESITATSPAGSGTADIQVVTPYGSSPAVSADRFTWVERPSITQIAPRQGPQAGGTEVTIYGLHLESTSTEVHFGATPATSVKVVSHQVTAIAPPGSGTVDVIVTTPGGGSSEAVQADRFAYEAGAPEFGRCLAFTGGSKSGDFTSSTCTTPTATGSYEWNTGLLKPGFTATATTAVLETATKAKTSCTAAHESGAVTGARTVGGVVLRLTGCSSAGKPCTTAGRGAGELESAPLEGTLGWEVKLKKKVALDLYPAGHSGPFLTYTCTGAPLTTISGSVLGSLTAGKMLSSTLVKYIGKLGHQKPEAFEGGTPDVLTNQLGERVGLTVTLTQANEEAVEISWLV